MECEQYGSHHFPLPMRAWGQQVIGLSYADQNQDQTCCCCAFGGCFLLRICSVFPALPKTRNTNHDDAKKWFWCLNTGCSAYGWTRTNDGDYPYRNGFSYHSDNCLACLVCAGPQVIHALNARFLKSSSPPLFSGRIAGHKVPCKAPQTSPRSSLGPLRSEAFPWRSALWEKRPHRVEAHYCDLSGDLAAISIYLLWCL